MKMLVSGCSFANGSGLPGEHSNPRIWANQLATMLGVDDIHNVSKTGANNHFIFLETMSELIKQRYDLVVVEWSAIPRYHFRAGLELYCTDTRLDARQINLVGHKCISADWFNETRNRLLRLHNDHWDILDLIKYINILLEIQANTRKSDIFFVNGLGPWSDQYFVKKCITLPSDLDNYTYDLLQADLRDDDETLQLYDLIHSQYESYGGIHQQHWLNLYSSQERTKIDTVSVEDGHPGYASQDLFADTFFNEIQQKTNTCPKPH